MAICKIVDDDHWRSIRREHIGASEIATLFEACPYLTVNQLYHVKRGNLGDVEENPLMRFGKIMEPVIAYLISDTYGWELRPSREYHEHPIFPWLGCTLDYDVVHSEHGAGILQIKNVQRFAPNWTGTSAPTHVELQVQHELFVTNAARRFLGLPAYKWAAIGSLHAGNPEDIRIMLRKPDTRVQKFIAERSKVFWQDMLMGEEPDIMGAKEYGHIADLFRRAEEAEPEMIDLGADAEFNDAVATMLDANYRKRQCEALAKEGKARIIHKFLKLDEAKLKRHTVAHTDLYAVHVKPDKRGAIRINVKDVK